MTALQQTNIIVGGGSRRLATGDELSAFLTEFRRHTHQDGTTGGAR